MGQAASQGERLEDAFMRTLGLQIQHLAPGEAVVAGYDVFRDPEQVTLLSRYGRRVGLAFQIADDLLNLSGDAATLGKAIGNDEARGKMTYPVVVGPAQARETGQRLVDEAARILEPLGEPAWPLRALAAYIMARTH